MWVTEIKIKADKKSMTQYSGVACRLNKSSICEAVSQSALSVIEELQVLETTSSTNDVVLNSRPLTQKKFSVCIANQQTSGRGRNGKAWQSPADAHIYLSIGVVLGAELQNKLNGLSLACGVVLSRVLESIGVKVGLKWPNDLLIEDKKLAGILVETRLQTNQTFVVVGVGLNIKMPEQAAKKIDQPWIDLDSVLLDKEIHISRNELAAKLLMALIGGLQEFAASGFNSFSSDWERFDMLTGRNVIIKCEAQEFEAKVLGFNLDHSIKVEIKQQQKTFYAADIKLKMVENVSS